VLAGGGLLGLGGLLGGGATEQVRAQQAAGQVGTSSDPVDVFGGEVDAQSVSAERLLSDSQLATVRVWGNDNGNVEAYGKSGIKRENSDLAALINGIISDTGGGKLFQIAEGEYIIGESLIPERGVTFQGAGMNFTTIKRASGMDAHLVDGTQSFSSNKLWFTLRDLDLDGNKANNTSGDTVNLEAQGSGDWWDIEIERCFLRDANRDSFRANEGHGHVIRNSPCEFSNNYQIHWTGGTDGRVLFSTIKGGKRGVVSSSNNTKVIGCQIQGIGEHGVTVGIGGVVVGNEIRTVSTDSPGDFSGVSSANGDYVVVVGNSINGGGDAKFGVQFGSGSRDCAAYGNTIRNVQFWPVRDTGTRNVINGFSRNGANDPASAGDWNGNGREGVIVKWDDGAGNHYATFWNETDGQWWDIPVQ